MMLCMEKNKGDSVTIILINRVTFNIENYKLPNIFHAHSSSVDFLHTAQLRLIWVLSKFLQFYWCNVSLFKVKRPRPYFVCYNIIFTLCNISPQYYKVHFSNKGQDSLAFSKYWPLSIRKVKLKTKYHWGWNLILLIL